MFKRSRIVWKLSAFIISIVIIVIVVSGYVSNLICSYYSLESARTVLNFNSESVLSSIGKLMMNRNITGMKELIAEMSHDSTVYRDVRLVSHHSGEIVISRYGKSGGCLDIEEAACARCHDADDLDATGTESFDQLTGLPEGGRLLSVVTPVIAEEGCMTAYCHSDTSTGSILGFLQADYSMGSVDALITEWNTRIILVAAAAILLSMAAMWFMFDRLLEKPINNLTAGIRKFAANNLGFRFDAHRNDEIGLLEESFNQMAARIEAHQAELKSAMDYLEGIVESSADIIITVNPEGLIQTFNHGAEQALGYRRVEVINRRIETLFARPEERDAAVRKLEHTDNVRNYETHFLTKNGEVKNVLLTLSRLRDPKGTAVGTFGISKDITQEKKLLKQLFQSEKLAAIGQAVTGIQHAIKNMLNALKGGAYLVRSGMAKNDSARMKDGWAMVEEGISRINNLSSNMLNYAKEWKPELEPVELKTLVEKIFEVMRETARQKGVALRTEFSGPPLPVLCDPKLIHMAVMDIVSNALDACTWKEYERDESPEVFLRVYSHRDLESSVIEICDNGIGMNEDIKKNIFTPFFSTKKQWGTGLGLALSSQIIYVHGGKITLESEPNQGAVFRIVLPSGGAQIDKEA